MREDAFLIGILPIGNAASSRSLETRKKWFKTKTNTALKLFSLHFLYCSTSAMYIQLFSVSSQIFLHGVVTYKEIKMPDNT